MITRSIEYTPRTLPSVACAQGWTGKLVRGVLDRPGVKLALCTGVRARRGPSGGACVRVDFAAVEAYWRWVCPATGRIERLPVARVYGWGEFPWWMQTAIRRKFARWEAGDVD